MRIYDNVTCINKTDNNIINTIYKKDKSPSDNYKTKNIRCDWCFGSHNSRVCPYEKLCNVEINTYIGNYFEDYIESNIKCIKCNTFSLHKLGDNTPSMDLICIKCYKKIELKSKCLSAIDIPNDIQCKGGNYNYLIDNITNSELDIIIIIYSVNRINKTIKIRHIYWINNYDLLFNDNINIIKNDKLSIISIKNRNDLIDIKLPKIINISLKSFIDNIMKTIDLNNKKISL